MEMPVSKVLRLTTPRTLILSIVKGVKKIAIQIHFMTLFEIDPLSSVLIAAVVILIDDTQSLFRINQTHDLNIPEHVSVKGHLFYFTN